MKNVIRTILLLSIFILAYSCSNTNEEEIINNELSNKKDIEIVQKIFSESDFDFFANKKSSVVNKLSKEVMIDFKESMWIGEDGKLKTAKYVGIEKDLSKEDQQTFWALFGVDYLLLPDYKEYKCVSPSNCKKLDDWICLTGC